MHRRCSHGGAALRQTQSTSGDVRVGISVDIAQYLHLSLDLLLTEEKERVREQLDCLLEAMTPEEEVTAIQLGDLIFSSQECKRSLREQRRVARLNRRYPRFLSYHVVEAFVGGEDLETIRAKRNMSQPMLEQHFADFRIWAKVRGYPVPAGDWSLTDYRALLAHIRRKGLR